MKTIWKYQVLPLGVTVAMPVGATVLNVHEQNDGVFMWAEVEPSNALVTRRFTVYATDQMVEDNHEYRGTAFMKNGLVFHVYEVM